MLYEASSLRMSIMWLHCIIILKERAYNIKIMRKTVIKLSAFLVLVMTFSFCKQKLSCRDIKERYFSITENLKSKKDTASFLNDIDYLIEQSPRCLKAYQVRGFFRMLKGDMFSAKKDFLKTISLQDTSVYSNYCLSALYNIEGKNDSSFYFIEKARKLKSRGKYVINSNNYFSQDFDISYDEIIFQRAIIYYETGSLNLARQDFLKAIFHHHEKGEAYAYISAVYSKLNNIDSACFYQGLAKQYSYDSLIDSTIIGKCEN